MFVSLRGFARRVIRASGLLQTLRNTNSPSQIKVEGHLIIGSHMSVFSLWERNKISVITDISVLGFYGNIGGYFDKNIGNAKFNKNTLKFMEILC